MGAIGYIVRAYQIYLLLLTADNNKPQRTDLAKPRHQSNIKLVY